MKRPLLALAALAALAGCKGTSEDSNLACGVTATPVAPTVDQSNFYYRGYIEVELSDPDTTAVLSLKDASGADVGGKSELNEDGDVVYFYPSSPLSPSAAYTAVLNYCTGTNEIPFKTSELGGAMTDPTSLAGKVYKLDLASEAVRIVIPEGVGDVLKPYLTVTIFMQVADATAGNLAMFGALGDEEGDGQEFCDPTIDFPAADFSAAPYFLIGPADTKIAVAGYEVEIADLEISGTFSPDGSYWGGGVLAGSVDTRPLSSLLDETGENPGAICDTVAGFGVACEACPNDGELFCLSIRAINLGGAMVEDLTLEEIPVNDCHDQCVETFLYDATTGECVDISNKNPECEIKKCPN